MDMGFSCRKNAFFQASIKLTHPFPAPELWTNIFADTMLFLSFLTPPVLGGAVLFDNSTPEVYKIQGP